MFSQRLKLCALNDDDADDIYKIRSCTLINKYINRKPCESLIEAVSFIEMIHEKSREGDVIYWAIRLISDDTMAGTICIFGFKDQFKCEIGYELLPEHQGKGIMLEAVKCVMNFCTANFGTKQILADVMIENERSIALLQKFNFTQIEILEDGFVKFEKSL
jgi:ribosomal-protein-alanine N-acetyltransferase